MTVAISTFQTRYPAKCRAPLFLERSSAMRGDATVYMHLDEIGRVLYVGMAANLAARTRQHASSAEWWPLVAAVMTVGTWPRYIAAGVEKGLIVHYDPPGNFVNQNTWVRDMLAARREVA